MIVNEIIDKIVACFNEETKAILEHNTGGYVIPIKKQFLYYYSGKCLVRSEEETLDAITYIIQENYFKLEQLKDLILNREKFLDLKNHTNTTLKFGNSINSGHSISVNLGGSKSEQKNNEESLSLDKTYNESIGRNESGGSQQNKLFDVDEIIKPKQLEKTNSPTYTNTNGEITINSPQTPTTTTTQETKKEKPEVYYQEFTVGQTIASSNSDDSNQSALTSNAKGESFNVSNTDNIHANKNDAVNRQYKFHNADALIKKWETEIPKLRRKFWIKFQDLFAHEYLY